MALPELFEAAVERVLAERQGHGRRAATLAMSEAYRSAATSRGIDFAAYLVARLPATYAGVAAVLGEVNRLRPDLAPASLLDAGAGPGTASWAACEIFESLGQATFLDSDAAFLALAQRLAGEHRVLGRASVLHLSLIAAQALPPAGLVIAAYALAEIPDTHQARVIASLWQAAQDCLVLVEPGTPAGFARLHGARRQLLQEGAHMIGPCTHEAACPMVAPRWCHFAVRLERSRAHMHAKGASLPFEDEKVAWLAVSRAAGPLPEGRLVASPRQGKAGITLELCTLMGLERRAIARRDSQAYKAARKLRWGDSL